MAHEDPFEAEERRRSRQINDTDKERLEAIEAEESLKATSVAYDPEQWKYFLQTGREDPVRILIQESVDQIQTLSVQEWVKREKKKHEQKRTFAQLREEFFPAPEEPRLPPNIGGWRPGDSKQTHEALRFEIEADRALFMGKPVPRHDKELEKLHVALHDLHVRYQQTGDPSLLIGIADAKNNYERRMKELEARQEDLSTSRRILRTKEDARHDEHHEVCVDFFIQDKTCDLHGLPRATEEWTKYLKAVGTRRHVESCVRPGFVYTARCSEHSWPIDHAAWDMYKRENGWTP